MLSLILFLLFLKNECWCLELRGVEVPALTELFLPVSLGCRYRLGTDRLQSVKWYKDDEEFYRFTPSERPQVRQFDLPGAYVQLDKSDMHIVRLRNVSILSAGVYRCEVSAEGPYYDTVQQSARMDVYALPDRNTEIKLKNDVIFQGEEIEATCTSGLSYPKQTLLWYLNGIQLNSSCITSEKTSVNGRGLLRSESTLKMTATGGPGPMMLSCVGKQDASLPLTRHYLDLTLRGEPHHQRFIDLPSSGNKPTLQVEQHYQFYFLLKILLFVILFLYAYSCI